MAEEVSAAVAKFMSEIDEKHLKDINTDNRDPHTPDSDAPYLEPEKLAEVVGAV